MSIALAGLLILLGAVSRLIPHPDNFVMVGMGGLALYAGARLPRRWAFLVPLAAMFASDVVLDWGHGFAFFGLVRMTSYATLAFIGLAGGLARGRIGGLGRVGMSVGASTLFYLTTNFAVWAMPLTGGASLPALYPLTLAGLLTCFAAGVPFYVRTLAADLLGTGLLFGLDALARRWAVQTPASIPVQAD